MRTRPKSCDILDMFFNPQRVAIVGLSRSAMHSAVSVLTTLEDFGYQGEVYIINPNIEPSVEGRIYPDLESLPQGADLSIVSVPRAGVMKVLEDCVDTAIGAAIVITQGFADADEEGRRLQRQMVRLTETEDIRIIGPNTIGVTNAFHRFTSSFIEVHPDNRSVGQVSQSGLFMMGHSIVGNEPAGFCLSVDLGNACDVSMAEVIEYYGNDDRINVIECHLEGIEDGEEFVAVASRVSRQKPIIALKAGRTRAGSAAVASHSGAAAGENEVYQAAFRKAGLVSADSAEELRMLSKAFAIFTPPRGKRVAVMSFSGGGAILAIDAIENAGLTLATLGDDSREHIQALLPDWMTVDNPVDVWIPVSRDFHAAYPEILEKILADPGVDAVLCIYCSYTLPKYAAFDASRHLGALASKYPDKPVLGWSYGLDITGFTGLVEKEGPVMVFPSLDAATRTLAKLVDYRRYLEEADDIAAVPGPAATEIRVKEILGDAARSGRSYLFTEGFEILTEYGVPVADWRLARCEDELVAHADGVGYPVCLKVISDDVVHKSDAGGVRLGIRDRDALVAGYRGLRADVEAAVEGADIQGVVVQRMCGGGKEVMMGAKRDPVFGPCMILGAGGVYTEILDDYAFRLAPVGRAAAIEMIESLRYAKILAGPRGEPACDLAALVDILLKMSALVAVHQEIREIDLNPVSVDEHGAVVVDARIIV